MANSPKIFLSYSSQHVEDDPGFSELLSALAAIAGESAFAEAKVLRLPKIYATADKVILQEADGTSTTLTTAEKEQHGPYFKKFVPGQWEK